MADHLPPSLRDGYVAEPADVDLAPLHGRRATFEYVVRRYAAARPHVSWMYATTVRGLVSESVPGGLRIVGLEVERAGRRETIPGDVIVDAAGRNSPVRGWLEALGARIRVHKEPSELAYFCRHYRLRSGESEPPQRDLSADLDYVKYAIFYAEHGHFAVAFACAEQERDLLDNLRRPEGFDTMCRQIPVLRAWIDRSEPVTKVLGASKISNRWTRLAAKSGVTGFFFLGDAAFEANPIYGRGCAAAFIQSHLLAQVLVSESDPERRVELFDARLQAELLPYHDVSVKSDQLFHTRANRARGGPVSVRDRLRLYAYEKLLVPAVFADLIVAREILNVMSMGRPAGPARVFAFILRVLKVWLRHPLHPPALLPPNPSRAELLRGVGDSLDTASPTPLDG
jgi:2-polyprenyl-6-methoxyphenol hydroxylase-like FAD-dependent oxidoreductase